jgi:hypothetical protein
MLALQQSLPVQLDQPHRLPVTLDHAAAARMLPLPASCGLQSHIKASTTHNAFKFGTGTRAALQKRALTYLLQYTENIQEIMQNMTQKNV